MPAVITERRGHVLLVTLNRPEARNALSPEVIVRLDAAWNELRDDPELRVGVVTGTGEKSFCAGADLARLIPLISGNREAEDEWDEQVLSNPKAMANGNLMGEPVGKPIIAALNGHTMGGGLELAMNADLRIAAAGIQVGLPEVKRALFPGGGGVIRLARAIPPTIALEHSLTGDPLDAAEAHRLGLLNAVVDREELIDAALDLAARIARNGPLAVKAILATHRDSDGLPLADALALSGKLGGPIFRTEDAAEGARAFVEKRDPVYRGR